MTTCGSKTTASSDLSPRVTGSAAGPCHTEQMTTPQKTVLLPLVGLGVAWVLFMAASFSELFVQPIFDAEGFPIGDGPAVRASTYLYLSGLAAFSILSLQSLRMSVRHRTVVGTDEPLTRASYRFANLSVIVGLAGSVVFGLVTFLGAFNRFGGDPSLASRLLGVYLPIVLAAGVVVAIILVAFVFRTDTAIDGAGAKEGLSNRQKALGLGYATPIIAGALAIIFGLVVYDITNTTLEEWVWVVIQVIIAAGIIMGTRFARLAKAEKPEPPKPRTALASGAWNLNFVLSIVFGAVVSVMAFTFGSQSFEALKNYNFDYAGWDVRPISAQWLIGDFAPALVLIVLVIIGLYATITERHKTPDTRT
jgi:hypothetical protein